MEDFIVKTLNYLIKDEFDGPEEKSKSVFRNEEAVFNVTIYSKHLMLDCKCEIVCDNPELVKIFRLDRVPVPTPTREFSDDYYITNKNLISDILSEFNNNDVVLKADFWSVFTVSFNNEEKSIKPGNYTIKVVFKDNTGNIIGETSYVIKVLSHELKELEIYNAHWIHYDCLATYYNLEAFSPKYYELLNKFLRNLKLNKCNTLMVPLFTYPLDTMVGDERPTAQLIDVKFENEKYEFDFTRLDYFVDNALSIGFKYFEFSHLFTQWGAEKCPKIIVNGEKQFGWSVDSTSKEYLDFLDAFLTKLNIYIENKGLKNKCFYHISDEPYQSHLERYGFLHKFVSSRLTNAIGIDAMRDIEYVKNGFVDVPIVASSFMKSFFDNKIENYWLYYCVTQRGDYLSNRFISCPGERTRILGTQLYLNDAKGFLHFGYNFYYSYLSKRQINPFYENDNDGVQISGDAFVVYPGKNGPIESIRIKYVKHTFNDFEALKLLESKKGKDFVVKFLLDNGMEKNYTGYIHDPYWLTSLREKINSLIEEK